MEGEALSFSHFFLNNPADVEFLHGVLRQEGGTSRECTVYAKDDGGRLHSMVLPLNSGARRVGIDDRRPKPYGSITLADLYGTPARLSPSSDGGIFELAFDIGVPPDRFLSKLKPCKRPRRATHLKLDGAS